MKNKDNMEDDRKRLSLHEDDIGRIDDQIISLLSKRQDLAVEIGKLKRRLGIEAIDPSMKQALLQKFSAKEDGNLNSQAIKTIFSEIISAEQSVQELPRVAFLGPEATFSHQAADSFYGKSASFRPAETIEEVFDLVENGVCHQGIVPIENSYEGSVNITLDLLFKYDLKIRAEIFMRIRHNLLGAVDDINEIEHLYSHPMPVAQCRSWLKDKLHGVPVTETASTSLAVKMAAGKSKAAAIGSRLAGQMHGLKIVEENIEDHPDNATRFIVIGKGLSKPTGKDKSSILFFLSHRPGALYKSLSVLAEKKVNMTRIESRPMKIKNWEYLFFVDIEGHESEENIGKALTEMEKHCAFMKRLGSYPEGGEPWE